MLAGQPEEARGEGCKQARRGEGDMVWGEGHGGIGGEGTQGGGWGT